LDRALFEAVQSTLAANGTDRQLRLKSSPAMLMGRIFDDRGNRMSPTHTNKRGVRYRYYLSQAVLQKRNEEAGSVTRVPAPEIEALVIRALRERFGESGAEDLSTVAVDRDWIERYVDRVTLRPDAIEIRLSDFARDEAAGEEAASDDPNQAKRSPALITLPWAAPSFTAIKGLLHTPSQQSAMKPETRDALLTAVAKARSWIDDLVRGRVSSLAEIAKLENKVERHIRLLAPLAFVSPRIIAAIIDGSAPNSITVTGLARRLCYSWAGQERQIRF
jgi:hypothetical protein